MQSPNIFRPVRERLVQGRGFSRLRRLFSNGVNLNNRGFTLIEILVVIAIFTLLIGLGLFMTLDAYRGFNFRSERDVVVSVLEKARSRAMANMYQSPWGVCYIAPNYLIFKGTTCTATDSDVISANAGVAAASNFVSTFPTVVFSQLAATTTGGTVTVVQNGRTSTATINYEGTIIW